MWDKDFFAWLEENIFKALELDNEALEYIIEICCRIKAEVVEQDETEQGRRAILNYGHTVGHAVETLSGYGAYLHGEAVAIGMVAEARLAQDMGLIAPGETERIVNLLNQSGLPVKQPSKLDIGQMIDSMYTDKKVTDSKLTFALPQGLGCAGVYKGLAEEAIIKIIK
nr:hypothetical protein [Desulforamulus aquiferis]